MLFASLPLPFRILSSTEEADIKEQAIIYRQQSSHLLTEFHHRVNIAAQDICLKNPETLTHRGKLLDAVQEVVRQSDYYQFKTGKSRSKKVDPAKS